MEFVIDTGCTQTQSWSIILVKIEKLTSVSHVWRRTSRKAREQGQATNEPRESGKKSLQLSQSPVPIILAVFSLNFLQICWLHNHGTKLSNEFNLLRFFHAWSPPPVRALFCRLTPSSNHKSQNIYYNIFVSRSRESQTLWFQKSKRQNYMGSSWKQEYFQQGKTFLCLPFLLQ